MAQWSDLPLVLTSDQAAAVLQIARRTVTNMLDRGDLRGIKVGKEWRISRAELLRFVEAEATPEANGKASPTVHTVPPLAEKGGILVVQAQPTVDLAAFVDRERERRIDDLIHQAGW